MRHRAVRKKLGRSSSHRQALVTGLVCNLIKERRITTTVQKAKIARSLAEKMVTMARPGTLSARRHAISLLHQVDVVETLFAEIVPICEGRAGGYTRVLKLGRRGSDGSEMALLEWVGRKTEVATA
ncbi:MAG TPA: 50S ribosomal protein L17 [Verrucomicrobia bacterium]|nr:50S ribosomal protein L17 [Verrucomicrobiota bacterium]